MQRKSKIISHFEKNTKRVFEWSVEEVGLWLESEGFTNCVEIFSNQFIDGDVLLTLTINDLKEPPINLQQFGTIQKLNKAIQELVKIEEKKKEEDGENLLLQDSQTLVKKLPKLAFSICYFATISFITAFTMTIVHDRVPNQESFPPLPDVFLDNIPLIPWAFILAEVLGLIMTIIFCLTLLFHKHRIMVLSRVMAITASVFLLRCVTMFVTSLSVPGVHLTCSGSPIGVTIEEKLQYAWRITSGFGMSINGVRSCGDYMFSGHTIVLTMLNLSISEYTPADWTGLHIFTYVSNIFGMFFILAAHEHYTIDVIIAFYITTRVFQNYHTLANINALKGPHGRRVRSLNPVFSYLEEDYILVTNEYEWPWEVVKRIFLRISTLWARKGKLKTK